MTMTVAAGIVFFLICSPLLLVLIMIIRNTRKSDQKQTTNYDKSITELIPIRYYDQTLNAYVLDDNSYMNLIKINTKDIYSESEEEREWDNMRFSKLYQTYPGELKFIILNFPTNTSVQQEYWKHKISMTANPILRRQQEEKLYQLEWLQSNSTKREFYMLYYAADKEELKKATNDILVVMGTGRDGLAESLSQTKKHQILFKISNKSAQIFSTKDGK